MAKRRNTPEKRPARWPGLILLAAAVVFVTRESQWQLRFERIQTRLDLHAESALSVENADLRERVRFLEEGVNTQQELIRALGEIVMEHMSERPGIKPEGERKI